MMRRIALFLVDDQEIFRQGLHALLDREPDIEVVGQAGDGKTALKLARSLQPDVISMRVFIPEANGIDATRQILRECPRTRVLALAPRLDRQVVIGMLEAGALGYLTQDCSLTDYLKAVREVAAGRMYFSSAATEVLVREYLAGPRPSDLLSPREREVLQLIAQGLSTAEVARKLCLSGKTVETHRRSVMRKIGTQSIAGLTKYAIRQGLTSL